MNQKSRVLRNFALSILFLWPFTAHGQWRPDSTKNTPVCVIPTSGKTETHDHPAACSDGANGAIIVWEDNRSGPYQIYAQHLNQFGVPQWAKNGIAIANFPGTNNSQTNPLIATDSAGGAYVIWSDGRNSSNFGPCIYAQHILANGTLAYTDTGDRVGIGFNTGCTNPAICDDGTGGAWVTWEDNRSTNANTRPDIWFNRLWKDTVKYGLISSGTGSYYYFSFHGTTTQYFHDPNAHWKPYMVGANIVLNGKQYQIAGVTNDTQIRLQTYPPTRNSSYSYYVEDFCGFPLDTVANKQTMPTMVGDGKGGCYVAWITSTTVPNSIYGTHIDSTGKSLWDPAPGPGAPLYINTDPAGPAKSVYMTRDGNQLLLTWEVMNSSTNSEEIFANRMNDTVPIWGSAVDVTSGEPDDHLSSQIFSDDSLINFGLNSAAGAIVPFVNTLLGAADDYDINMVRIKGSGELLPNDGTYFSLDKKPHAQIHPRSVKISTPGSGSSIISTWTDAWDGTDTMLYAQRIDLDGRKYFPNAGTQNDWGIAISGHSPTASWSAKEQTIVPTSTGAIVAWADNRSGNLDIYAQYIGADGSLWIPVDTTPPTIRIDSASNYYNGQTCNSQCTYATAQDEGALITGIDTIFSSGSSNMTFDLLSSINGKNPVHFSVCVIDSMKNGADTIMAKDTIGNAQSMIFSYCTIPDTFTPLITWDTLSPLPNWLVIHINDNAPWSRGLSSITFTNSSNVSSPDAITKGEFSDNDTVKITDSAMSARFTVKVTTVSGVTATAGQFTYTPANQSVVDNTSQAVSFSLYPNPSMGSAMFQLSGADAAEVTITDMLGRTVDQFHMENSHEWNSPSLPSGIYIARAVIGGTVISKRIVLQ